MGELALTPLQRARFEAKLKRDDETGCLIFTGSRMTHYPYGQIRIDYKLYLAHRVAFFAAGGVTTDEKPYVLHSCDNPGCCEPAHLYAGTLQRNMWDRTARGRAQKGRLPPGISNNCAGFAAYTDLGGRRYHGNFQTWQEAAAIAALQRNLLLADPVP